MIILKYLEKNIFQDPFLTAPFPGCCFCLHKKIKMNIENRKEYIQKKHYIDILFHEGIISFNEWYQTILDLMENHNVLIKR